MRLYVQSTEGLVAAKVVEPHRPTILRFEASSLRAVVMDVLCLRPDGRTWHMGSVVARPGTHEYEVELTPFRLVGPHVLSVELGGGPLAVKLPVEVVPVKAKPAAARRNRRYLGRGGQ
jgi:hypothetical protein